MEKIRLWLCFVFIVILTSCGTYSGTYQDNPRSIKYRHYDNQGRYTGYSIESPSGKIRHYDKSGRYKGYSK